MLKNYALFVSVKTIRFYQRTFSFDHGMLKIFYPFGFCRFHPTCSDYAIAALEKYGLFKGGRKALWRIMRCHPFSAGGHDPA